MGLATPFMARSESLPSIIQPSAKSQATYGAPWTAATSKRFPYLPALCLFFGVLAAASALIILRVADDSAVDDWTVSPTIIFSVLAVVSRSLLHSASYSGGDIFWWSRIIEGSTLAELQQTWSFGHSVVDLLDPSQSWNAVRVAAISVLSVAAVGPLLQRSITAEVGSRFSERQVTLPVRVQPMWNLTALRGDGLGGGLAHTLPLYQKEFAEIVSESSRRVTPMLPYDSCEGYYCSTDVIYAGFSHSCDPITTANSHTIEFIGPARSIPDPRVINEPWTCANRSSTPKDAVKVCSALETWFQVAIGWESFPVPMITYTSYVRQDPTQDKLLIQRCNFTTAFIRTPIIEDSGIIRMDPLIKDNKTTPRDEHGLLKVDVVEPIGPATKWEAPSILGGFVQALRDSFEGYAIWDTEEGADLIGGAGPRAAVNPEASSRHGFGRVRHAFKSPLPDVALRLHELSLRYAFKQLPINDVNRTADNEDHITNTNDEVRANDTRGLDQRASSQARLKTTIATEQTVMMYEIRSIALYRARYIYAAIAAGIAGFAALAIIPMMWGWRQLGRAFTTSPLEIAKAFEAPLLRDVGSNSTEAELRKAVGRVHVRYGEVTAADILVDGEGGAILGQEMEDPCRLVVGVSPHVRPPQQGKSYL